MSLFGHGRARTSQALTFMQPRPTCSAGPPRPPSTESGTMCAALLSHSTTLAHALVPNLPHVSSFILLQHAELKSIMSLCKKVTSAMSTITRIVSCTCTGFSRYQLDELHMKAPKYCKAGVQRQAGSVTLSEVSYQIQPSVVLLSC